MYMQLPEQHFCLIKWLTFKLSSCHVGRSSGKRVGVSRTEHAHENFCTTTQKEKKHFGFRRETTFIACEGWRCDINDTADERPFRDVWRGTFSLRLKQLDEKKTLWYLKGKAHFHLKYSKHHWKPNKPFASICKPTAYLPSYFTRLKNTNFPLQV